MAFQPSRLICAGCYSPIAYQVAHGLIWCNHCYQIVLDGIVWQEQWRLIHPDEPPGAAAIAWTRWRLHFSLDK